MLNGKIVGAVFPAAGSGRRMGCVAKQFLEIQEKPVMVYALELFQQSPLIDRIVIAGPQEALPQIRSLVDEYHLSKVSAVVPGGSHRQDSVWNGICALPPEEVDMIAVHDAARPFLTNALLEEVVRTAEQNGAAIAAAPSADTVKLVDTAMNISSTIDRALVWFAQTPQAFWREALIDAFQKAQQSSFQGTDEASLMEHAGYRVVVVPATKDNFKITTPEDLEYLQFLANKRF